MLIRLLPLMLLCWSAAASADGSDPLDLQIASDQPAGVNAFPLEAITIEGSRLGGPGSSESGANDYAATASDIQNIPSGNAAPVTEVLAQMPGVAIDQNQQIHIRNTEGPQFQYQINGILVPFDINTNPPFLSMINPLFMQQVDLLDGILPARYSYATGGVVDIKTKDGCRNPGGEVSVTAGQRDFLESTLQYAGCAGPLSSYVSVMAQHSNTAFSSATPGPDPIHDLTGQAQAFGFFSASLDPTTKMHLLLSGAGSRNQLPDVPGLRPAYELAEAGNTPSSAAIDSYLNFSDYLAVLSISAAPSAEVNYQFAYSDHGISQRFRPDDTGELLYQGVASTADHVDHDHTLQGDIDVVAGASTWSAGFYAGAYGVQANDSSLVFPVSNACAQTPSCVQSSAVPIRVVNNSKANNVVLGAYLNELWQIAPRWKSNLGLRWDHLNGYTSGQQVDPTLNLMYAAGAETTLHAGMARYFQVPSFLGISRTAQAAFAGTSAEGPSGVPTPDTEDDLEWDAGATRKIGREIRLSADAYYEKTRRYLDTGQFGVVPIFAPFNYAQGHIWGLELAARRASESLSTYANVTIGRNLQRGVLTGQFNFPGPELAYIDGHAIVLDHQPLVGASAGITYRGNGYALSADGIYSSGLRAGFADLEQLPTVVQCNVSAERAWELHGVGKLSDRMTVLNLFDRVNLIRPAQGIGIFQAAYGPRFTVMDTLSLQF